MKYVLLLFVFLFFACSSAEENKEQESLRTFLISHTNDITALPVYADPPTGDYDDLRKGKVSVQDSVKLAQISQYKTGLEPVILERIDSGYTFVYLAAYLKYESAIPLLKKKLLQEDGFHFYGWEGGLTKGESNEMYVNERMKDHQYPEAMAYLAAIECISGKPISQSGIFSKDDQKILEKRAQDCLPDSVDTDRFTSNCSAKWLLYKLKGETKH